MTKISKDDTHPILKPYLTLGMDIDYKDGDRTVTALCPFCDREGRWNLVLEGTDKEKWRCPACNEGADSGKVDRGGNLVTFLRLLWKRSVELTSGADLQVLTDSRKLLDPDTLEAWGICKNYLTGEWLVPGYGVEGKLNTLYRYIRSLVVLPGTNHQLHGVNHWDASKPDVMFAEGWSDGACLWEMLRHCKRSGDGDGKLSLTSNLALSLYASTNVVAAPGAMVFPEGWGKLFQGKKLILLYDNDHPRERKNESGKFDLGQGYQGMQRIAKIISRSEFKPKTTHYLHWSKSPDEEGYDSSLKDGFDVRDFLSQGQTSKERVRHLEQLLSMVKPVPQWWLTGVKPKQTATTTSPDKGSRKVTFQIDKDGVYAASGLTAHLAAQKNGKATTQGVSTKRQNGPPDDSDEDDDDDEETGELGNVSLDCLPCDNWKTLIIAWRKALKWTPGLDCGLSVMLSSVLSTTAVGDQLWIKLCSPPSCLDAATPIYDPADRTTLTVAERFILGKKFHVYTRVGNEWWDKYGNEVTVGEALPPSKFPPAAMYKVTFESGREISVTGGHKFWNGNDYVSLEQLIQNGDVKYPTIPCIEAPYRVVEFDRISEIEYLGEREYYDFHVPVTNNYWAGGFFHHNSGKTVLCEALSVSSDHVVARSSIRGFHSGYKSDKTGAKDHSLISKLKNKTLVVKDGDALLKVPNLEQILSEARDIYDRVARTEYRNGTGRSYEGFSMTWILCGTASLHALDSSELGERFLDCVIVDKMEVELEREIALRKAYQADNEMCLVSEGGMDTMDGPEMVKAKQLTGGYVNFLRENSQDLIKSIKTDEDSLHRCTRLAEFVSYMRTRPSKSQDEEVQRELCFRLTSQLVRLSRCLGAVLNRKTRDDEVMKRTHKVAMDTCRGKTYEIAKRLYAEGRTTGCSLRVLSHYTLHTEQKLRSILGFLSKIGVAEVFTYQSVSHPKGTPRYRLTEHFHALYEESAKDLEG